MKTIKAIYCFLFHAKYFSKYYIFGTTANFCKKCKREWKD